MSHKEDILAGKIDAISHHTQVSFDTTLGLLWHCIGSRLTLTHTITLRASISSGCRSFSSRGQSLQRDRSHILRSTLF